MLLSRKILFTLLLVLSLLTAYAQQIEVLEVLEPPQGGFFSANIYDFEFDATGRLWIGNEDGEIFIYENNSWIQFNSDPIGTNDIYKIAFSEDGNVWVATDDGVFLHDGTTWTEFNSSNSDLLADSYGDILIDSEGKVYVGSGSEEAGLSVFDGTTWTVYTEANSELPSDYINDLELDNNGTTVWIATSRNVTRLNGATWTSFNLYDIFAWYTSPNVMQMDANNKLWVATEVGVKVFSNNQWLDAQHIAGSRSLRSMFRQPDGKFWMSEVFVGLLHYDGDDLFEILPTDTIPDQIFDFDMDTAGVMYMTGNRGDMIIKFRAQASTATEQIQKDIFSVYPNPVSSELHIQSVQAHVAAYQYRIHQQDGKCIAQGVVNKTIPMHHIPAGQYILSLYDESNRVSYFVIQRL
ncbi:MAG: hypothetical protein M3R25_02590 [Bacteroidota bacterium]|nr:hypothetical protein [Bacteroidota bacterium]